MCSARAVWISSSSPSNTVAIGPLILDWANDVIANYPNHRVIVLTHHAGDDNSDVNATTTSFSTQGSAIYDGLKANPNFFLMLGGHVFNEGGEGRRSDTFNGKTMRTLVSDYQGRFNGGNGLMRLMYFSPSNNLVSVKTYSPHTDTVRRMPTASSRSPTTCSPMAQVHPARPMWRWAQCDAGLVRSSIFGWSGVQASRPTVVCQSDRCVW